MLPSSPKDLIESLLTQHHCTVADIAERSGVSPKTIYRLLKGNTPRAKTYNQLIHLYLMLSLNPQEQFGMTKNQTSRNRLKKYYLGEKFPDISFTQRESDCMIHFIKGKTIMETAKIMGLSARTVEYYLSNMKLKMSCCSKTQLIEKILESDFMKNYKGSN